MDPDDKDELDKYSHTTIDQEWENKHTYELYGIVTHMGSMSGGHYVAYVAYR